MKILKIENSSAWRIHLLILIVLSFIYSCSRNKEVNPDTALKKYPSFILAGQDSGKGYYYHSFDPRITFQLHPGACSRTDSCLIDLNGDGEKDFILLMSGFYSSGGLICENSVVPVGNNEIAVRPVGSFLADILSDNDTINKKLFWRSGKCILNKRIESYPTVTDTGYWFQTGIRYLGVKVHYNDTLLYGWIRTEIYNSHFQYIYDYASTTGFY